VTSRVPLLLPMSTIAALAFLVVISIPLVDSVKLLMWAFLFAVFLLSISLLKRDEPASLWNIVCAIGLVVVARIVMMIATSGLTWEGLDIGVDAEIVTVKALVILILFILFGKIGYRWGCALAGRTPTAPLIDLERRRKLYIRIAVFGLIPLGIIVRFVFTTRRLGSLSTILTTLAIQKFSGHILSGAGLGFIVLFANVTIGGVALLLFLANTKRAWRFGLVIALAVGLVHMWTGRRSDILPIFLAVAFSYHYRIQRIRFRHWIALGIVGYAIMNAILLGRLYFSGAYAQRISSEPMRFLVEEMNLGIGGSIDGFLQVVAEEDGFSIRPWSYEAWYSTLWYPVPRALFPRKPTFIPIGMLVKGFYVAPSPYFDFESGVAPTILATLYLNAGYIGIAVGMIIWGMLLGVLDNQLLKRRTPDGWILHLAAWMLVFTLFRTGDLAAAVSQTISLFGGLVATMIAVDFAVHVAEMERRRLRKGCP